MARLIGFCLRHRLLVVAAWVAAIGLGLIGTLRLAPLLRSGFSLPGTDTSRVDQILARDYHASAGGHFVLVAKGDHALLRVRHAAAQAIRLLPRSRIDEVERLPSGAAAAFVETQVGGGRAAGMTGALRRRLGPEVLVTGDAAIDHDLGPLLAHDLRIGELYLAVPLALVILLLVFGTGSALLPFAFALATIPPTLGIAWAAAHVFELSDYLLNMVMMIGLGIAIDYSLLVVNRYRDERRHGTSHDEAVLQTMRQAGRTILFSGLAVSIGLALMLLLPVPFLRGFGLGGLLIPAVSVACALTLLPVMLASFGDRLEAVRIVPRGLLGLRRPPGALWAAHARWAIRHAKLLVPIVTVTLVLAALPLIGIRVGPSSLSSLPRELPARTGLLILQTGHGDALDPTTVVVAAKNGRELRAATAAMHRLVRLLHADREVASVSAVQRSSDHDYLRLSVVTRHDAAGSQPQAFAARLRDNLIPSAAFPAFTHVLAGGGAVYSVDFVSRTLGSFPWLILGVLGLTYLLLMRAFRSLFLPLKAIVLNLLTVAAASGLMIAVFQWGWGSWAGLVKVHQIESWIPVFMFALLFGLSMDYEVFLVTRMREAWDRTRSNSGAISHGLAQSSHVVTAAGLIMAATFSGLLLGSIPSMQQLGFGLATAILIDITLVRGLLLPSTMALAGRWNWYLPAWAASAFRIRT